jgi:hypothetical protein
VSSHTSIMPLERISDWEQRLARQDAFWDCAVIDRPVVKMACGKDAPERPWPAEKSYSSQHERWMDTERVVESAVAGAMNTEYLGDALPTAWPNLGPEVFSAFFGMEMEYTADTSWGIPVIEDWSDVGHVRFSEDNPYWKKLVEMTDALIEAGQGLYYTGLSDIHPGGDALAAFREPIDLNTDLLMVPDAIRAMLDYVGETYAYVYDFFHDRLRAAGQAITSWPGIVSTRKWYVPSNDFSCMISSKMFDEFFLPGIVEECRHMEACIYHLDGPDALRHLPSLLNIPELNAIQWVYGAGNGRASDWLHVYKQCQAAGKGIQLGVGLDELDPIIENLKPEGVFMTVDIRHKEEAEEVLRRVGKWT